MYSLVLKSICVYIYIDVYIYIYIYVYMYIYMFLYLYIYMYRFIYMCTYAYMHILFVDGFAVIWAGDHPTDICIYTYTFCRWSTIYRVHRHGAGAHAPQHMYSHSRIFFTFCTFGDIGIGGIDMFSHIENHSYSSHFCCCCVLVCVGGDLLGISSGRCKCGSR